MTNLNGASLDSKRGATIATDLVRRIERVESSALARDGDDDGVRAANSVLAESDVWQRDPIRAARAMSVLIQYYGLAALVEAANEREAKARAGGS
jgi:hypothetical protein